MTDIEFLKIIREICVNRCDVGFENGKEEYPECPFPWRFCDLDKNFYEMTDEELEKICEQAKKYQKWKDVDKNENINHKG